MSETTSQNDDGRTENKRFQNTVSGDELVVGDRIDTRLVARTFGELGNQKQPTYPEDDSEQPQTQLVVITQFDRYDDVHRALLADVDTGTIIRAGRHSSQSAWTQKEADWTVYDIGTTMRIDSVSELEVPLGYDKVTDEMKYVQHWVDVVIEDRANGYDDYNDVVSIPSSNNIKLRDIDGRKAYASYSLERN
jgi:hypothetical protein